MKSTDLRNRNDAPARCRLHFAPIGAVVVEGLMRAGGVVVRGIPTQQTSEVPFVEHDDVIEAFPSRLVALAWGGGMSDRADRRRLLGAGLLAYGVLIAAVILLTHPIALALWSLVIGGVAGLVAPQPTALIGDQVPPDLHGIAIGWLRTITDTGQILGPLAMGTLADAMDLSTPFVVGAALLIATAWPYRRRSGTMPPSAPS